LGDGINLKNDREKEETWKNEDDFDFENTENKF